MFPGNAASPGLHLRHALAGLKAGVLGSLAMLVLLMLASLWNRRSIWTVPNLFATTFYGEIAYRNHLMRTSWVGLALYLVIYAVLGIVWGCIWRDAPRPRLLLYGAIFGLAAYYVLFNLGWRHINPLITLYAPDRALRLGHIVWGMFLARAPKYSRKIFHAIIEPAAQEVEEVKSGEVIR